MDWKFWNRRKKAEVFTEVNPIEPLPLTGIERMWLEEESDRIRAANSAQAKHESEIRAEIAQIEAKIKPDTDQLAKLRGELNPYYSMVGCLNPLWQQQAAQSNYNQMYALFGGLGNILPSMW